MSESRSRFAEALSVHEQRSLRDAFDRANNRAKQQLHRTTLTRWLEGSVPSRGEFIQLLADELSDPALYSAWETARGTRSTGGYQAVVTRFDSLPEEDREKAYAEIRRSFLATRFPDLRERMSYRIEINDPPEGEADHLVVRLALDYDGRLPARSNVRLTTTHPGLGNAYEDPACIFRDRLLFEEEWLYDKLEAGPPPTLVYNPLSGATQQMTTHDGHWVGDGLFALENDEVENVRVRLNLEYPIPRHLQVYPIRFGEFRVAGGAEFTLALNARSASSPQAFPFPPAGRQREWAARQVRPNELVVSFGAGGTILADGDGLLLHWVEAG